MSKYLSFLALLIFATPALAQSPPGAPQDLSRTVNGTTVTLTWSAPTTGGLPSSYLVEAAFVPGGPVIASLPVQVTSLVVPNVPSGIYYVRVRALNGDGQSGSSNEVRVEVVGGCPGPPAPPQNLRVAATGLDVSVTWTAPTAGCAPASYVVLAGSEAGLSNIAQINLGLQLGIAAVAPPGTYFIRVVSVNAFGVSAPSDERAARFAVNAFTDTVASSGAVFFDLTLSATGAYEGVLTWNDPSLDLDLYLTTPGCSYPPTTCVLKISDAATGNREQVAWPVQAGETYRLWVDNFSGRASSFTIENSVSGAMLGAPGAPGMLTQDVNGSTVSLTWASPTTGGATSRYIIEATDTSGTLLASLDTGNAATSFSQGGVPAGVYVVRVRAANAAGIGPASAPVTVVVNP